jgi:UDP-N-acetylglucosamine 2-epimerase (non-hydrolysing)
VRSRDQVSDCVVLVVFGTRPEAIKLAPVVAEIERRPHLHAVTCSTGQHREMLDQVLRVFAIRPDHDLGVMQTDQRPDEVCAAVLTRTSMVLRTLNPQLVLVQGDTTSAMTAALAAFFQRIPVGHVEAGLRSGNAMSPYPEEMMRRLVSQIAALHFAPTRRAAEQLVKENSGVEDSVFWTGNTVVDAMRSVLASGQTVASQRPRGSSRLVLLTAHRRENFGAPLERICRAVRRLVEAHSDVEIVYPVHLNPSIRDPVTRLLGGHERIHLVAPMEYPQLIATMAEATIVLTDSGGIQEEAPILGRPTLVLREETERSEAIEAGTSLLVGTDESRIFQTASKLLEDPELYARMATAQSPFGDGNAAVRIADIIEAWHSRGPLPHRWNGQGKLAPPLEPKMVTP